MRQFKVPAAKTSLRKGRLMLIGLFSLFLGFLCSIEIETAFANEAAVDSNVEAMTESIQERIGQTSTSQNSGSQDSTGQDSTGQDSTGQDSTVQSRVNQDTDSKPTHNTFFNLPDKADRGRTENAGAAPEGGLTRMVFSLIGVIALIFICGAVAKRLGAQGPMRIGAVQVRSVQNIGTKEKLMVINAYGKSILIGVTPHAIHTLHTFEPGELEAFEAEQQSATSSTSINPMDTLLSKVGIKSPHRSDGRAEAREHNKFEEMLQKERVEQSEVDQKV